MARTPSPGEYVLLNYYAASTDMHDFVPMAGHSNKALQAAHDRVLDEMESPGSSLDHWRLVTEGQRKSNFLPTPSPSTDYEFVEGSDEDEFEIAKQMSLLHWNTGNNKRSFATSSLRRDYKKARVTPQYCSTSDANDLRNHLISLEKDSTASSTTTGTRRQNTAKLDFIEGDLSSSPEMVKVYVGEQEDEFLIPRLEIDRRPHLSDVKIGCVATMDDGTTRLDLQCLKDIDPVDFRFVAEFLSTGQFGHSVINEHNRDKAIAECAAAWPIADQIVLEDLLDHIVAKVQQARPWQPEEAWFFALMVYETAGTPLEAYRCMKDMIAKSMADNLFELIRRLDEGFLRRFQKLPELERDVYRILGERAEQKLDE
ncbi:uncharacterized protein N0V89_008515 [Didymosphaeria variabile]|uniref:BTB domain-containing protein n=1 Tax=Didymosphaeria variabile TaxID=1932322 RepID=A0A9W9C7V9_9PLEO|nr:uncharacterized protein N0V89_008515 [Didymosphaeria variabile]KAJ4349895.1 hypothetical protein N0V89_008515 [Didymosphaeria variabile]